MGPLDPRNELRIILKPDADPLKMAKQTSKPCRSKKTIRYGSVSYVAGPGASAGSAVCPHLTHKLTEKWPNNQKRFPPLWAWATQFGSDFGQMGMGAA